MNWSARAVVCMVFFGLTSPFGVAAPARAEVAYAPPPFREPVTLSSENGVLEVTLTARQGEVALDTATVPVKKALLFGYRLDRGTSSDGAREATDVYPAPTLKVSPGERLIVHLENGMKGLDIREFFDPRYTPEGGTVPLYPPALAESPLNLHTHGLHVSPRGNSDNVLIHMPPGTSNTYVYDVPKNMPQGMYWYHPHLHTLTAAHVYFGLAGMLSIGRADGDIPLVTEKAIPIRQMALQYNFVFDRAGPRPQFNNPNWAQFVSTLAPPAEGELANGSYRPILAPENFAQSEKGKRFATVWYAGPLSIHNMRGRFQFIPNNLQSFKAASGPAGDVPADPALPDHLRDIQFTVNGQFQPVIDAKPGQTEIWVLANVSDMAYITVQLTETATGRHPKIAIVAQDGNPSPSVRHPFDTDPTRLSIPPASRYAIAVTMPETGELVLSMPERGGGARTENAPGVLYTSNGTDNPPATLGTLSVLPSAVSYYDGFFLFPTQMLARAVVGGERGETVPFEEGQKLGAFTAFEDLSSLTPDLTRHILINGGFLNDLASKADPKTFIYAFDSKAFPNVPILQPRLDSVEEWVFRNENNDEHPIHVHVNDFQITRMSDPTTGLDVGAVLQGVDNANVPAPNLGPEETLIAPGELAIRTKFEDYAGLFVMHCHRLNHEDNGLMALVNVIPAVSSYAVAIPGAPGRDAVVRLMDGDRLLATVTPFPGFEGTLSVAMGDLDDDGVYDLVAATGPGRPPEVAAFSGASAFKAILARFAPYQPSAEGGVSVAVAEIDGGTRGNIVVGSGPGAPSQVRVFSSVLPEPGATPPLFGSFSPYPGDRSGVTVSTGFVDFTTGRKSIVTAPGPGVPAIVKVFVYPLLAPLGSRSAVALADSVTGPICTTATGLPDLTAEFRPFGDDYRGGITLATGWLAGVLGGAERIVVGQRAGSAVKVYSSGSALDGGPAMYLHSAAAHPAAVFTEMASLDLADAASPGVSVATTSTTEGADLLIGSGTAEGETTIRRYRLDRPDEKATALAATLLGETTLDSADGVALGGD